MSNKGEMIRVPGSQEMTTFPMISKAEILRAREMIERETRMSERTFVQVSSIFGENP